MAKTRKSQDSESGQDSGKLAEIPPLDVKSQIERLHKRLADTGADRMRDLEWGKIRDEFTNQALSQFASLVALIANNDGLPRQDRLEAMRHVQDIVAFEAEKLEPKIPENAPELWRDRDKSLSENPYQFACCVYADCFSILTKNALSKLDKTLTNQMAEHDAKFGKPAPDIYVPTKGERSEQLVQSVTWNDIMNAAPSNVQDMLRAYKTRSRRNYQANKGG